MDTKRVGILFVGILLLIGVAAGGAYISYSDSGEPESTTTVGYWEGQTPDSEIQGVHNNGRVEKDKVDEVVSRSIARVETIRGEPMRQDITVEVKTREEFRNNNPFVQSNQTYDNWVNTVWSAQLVIPKPVDAMSVRNNSYNENVLAYYLIGQNKIVVVVDKDQDYVYLSEQTIVHELTHALQDQRMGLESPRGGPELTIYRQTHLTMVEGEAQVVENEYKERCGTEWNCTNKPEVNAQTSDYPAFYATAISPYFLGEPYMTEKYEKGGWDKVDEAYTENPPLTMKDVVYPNQEHSNQMLVAEDTSRSRWSRYGNQGYEGRETVGIVGISSMLYQFSESYGVSSTGVDQMYDPNTGRYTYQTELADQYKYDSMIPYQDSTGQTGFVWVLVWENSQAADEFTDVYGKVLLEKGGEKIQDPEYNLKEYDVEEQTVYSGPSEFQGAYSVARNEEMVVIVHGPNKKSLSDLRPRQSEPLIVTEYQTRELEEPIYEIKELSERETQKPQEDGGFEYKSTYNVLVFMIVISTYLLLKNKLKDD